MTDEGCGLDGHSEHIWRYSGDISSAGRQCAYCLKKQTMMGLWQDIEEGWD